MASRPSTQMHAHTHPIYISLFESSAGVVGLKIPSVACVPLFFDRLKSLTNSVN